MIDSSAKRVQVGGGERGGAEQQPDSQLLTRHKSYQMNDFYDFCPNDGISFQRNESSCSQCGLDRLRCVSLCI